MTRTVFLALVAVAAAAATDFGQEAPTAFKTEPWNAAEMYRPHWPSGVRWRDDVELGPRSALTDGDYLTVLNVFPKDPGDANAFGATWKHRAIRLNHVVIRYLAVKGRCLEPTQKGQRLEWSDGKRWQALCADLAIIYSHTRRFARHRSLGYSEWHYTFAPLEARAVRCVVSAVAQPVGQPAGVSVAEFSAGLDPDVHLRESTGSVRVVGKQPEPPGFEPELASAAHGATVELGGEATVVRWPHAMMADCVEVRFAAGKADQPGTPQWWDGAAWRPIPNAETSVSGDAIVYRFPPRAAPGLRIVRPGSQARRISVTCCPKAAQYFNDVWAADKDLLTLRLREETREPDYETLGSYLLSIPGYKTAVGRKDHPVEAFVTVNGSVILVEGSQDVGWENGYLAGGNWLLKGRGRLVDRWFALACGNEEEEFGADRRLSQRGMIQRGLPGVSVTYQHDGCALGEEVFTTAEREGVHAVVVALAVKNTSPRPVRTAVCLVMGRNLSESAWSSPENQWRLPASDFANRALDYRLDADGQTVRRSNGEIVVQSDRAAQWAGTAWERVLRVPLSLESSQAQTVRFVVPQVTESISDAARLARIRAHAARQNFSTAWEEVLARGMQIKTPEPVLNEAWRNLLGQLMVLFQDGASLRYGGYWYETSYGLEDGWPAVALCMWGHARDGLTALRTLCGPLKLNKNSYHHQYMAGVGPASAWMGYQLTRNREFLRAVLPSAIANAEWIIEKTGQREGRPSIAAGLLPRHTYGGDIHTPAYSLGSTAMAWRGLRDTAAMCAADGRASLAQRYRDAAQALHARLAEVWRQVADRSVDPVFYPMAVELGEPGEPNYRAVERTYPRITDPDRLGAYWQIFMLCVVENAFYPWRSPETTHMLRYSEERGGLKACQLALQRQSIDAHYTWGYYRACVDRGETDKVLAGLYGFLAHNADRQVLTFAENSRLSPWRTDNAANLAQYRRAAWDWGPYFGYETEEPLASSCGVALQLLRFLLLYEETDERAQPDGTLSILPHAPRRWFRQGQQVSVAGAPSYYGKMDFQMQSHSSRGQIELDLRAEWHTAPQSIRLRLRHPQSAPIRSVTVNGRPHGRFDAEWVYLPGGTTQARVVASY